MEEIRQRARERLQGYCRVCSQCDGRACAGEVPGFGGIGTGSSFTANYESLARWKLNLRTIHGAKDPDPKLKPFGYNLTAPILGAPIAGTQNNMGGVMTDVQLTAALLKACRLVLPLLTGTIWSQPGRYISPKTASFAFMSLPLLKKGHLSFP